MIPLTPERLPARHVWPATVRFGDVVLAPFRRRDIKEWSRVRDANAAWLRPWDATTPPPGQPPRSAREMVADYERRGRAGEMAPWVIRYDTGTETPLVGQCTLSTIIYGSARSAVIGYWIDERWAGRGIVPRAVALATDYAFTTIRLHRIEICIRPENHPSLRVVEKLGFRFEGVRPRFLHIDGQWRDHACFALHDDEVGDGLRARWARTHPAS
ncbi:MAG: GNAT family N-acetyltransferase [Propionibacteriaceae bacterium]|jgi:ribosomal-protein-alanine N-acetyltransferase|nr:GNAT family N-acetyltransferase [Propionibacteriaceae bacterium]